MALDCFAKVLVLGGVAKRSGASRRPWQQPGTRTKASVGRIFNHYSTGNGMWVSVGRIGVHPASGPTLVTGTAIDKMLIDVAESACDPKLTASNMKIVREFLLDGAEASLRYTDAVQDEDQAGLEGLGDPEMAWEGVGTLTWGGGGDGGDALE